MSEVLDVRRIDMSEHSEADRRKIARRVLELKCDDYMRIGAERDQLAIIDPDNKDAVQAQQERLENPIEGAENVWSYDPERGKEVGVVQVGLWHHGDAKLLGAYEQVKALAGAVAPIERRARGLHVFSVEQGLARASLVAVRYELVPAKAPLNVVAAVNDTELHEALSYFGAPNDGPVGTSQIGEFKFQVQLRQLPPLERKSDGNTSDNAKLLL